MKRIIRLIVAFLKIEAIRQMEYKADFFISIAIACVFQASNIVFYNALWARVGGFPGLSRMEMLFFLGTFIISDSIWSVFAFFGVMDLPNLIRDGRMDHYLTKPVSSQFFATFRSPSIMASLSIPLGIVLITIAVGSGQCDVPACGWLGWAVLVAAGAAVSYSCGVIVMSLAFIMLSVNAVWMLYSEIVDVQRYPIGIFPRPLRMVFTITLPVLLVANVPAHFALGKMGLAEAGWLIGVSAVLVFLSARFWKYGLKRYQSASS